MIFGYARVASDNMQSEGPQLEQLREAGCARIYIDRDVPSVGGRRPELERVLKRLQRDDAIVVSRLDRLGRSFSDLLALARLIDERGAHLRSLTEDVDTADPSRRVVLDTMARFEHHLLAERTKDGMKAAAQRGRSLGRPPLLGPNQLRRAEQLLQDPKQSLPDVARALGVSAPTLRRAFAARSQADLRDTKRRNA